MATPDSASSQLGLTNTSQGAMIQPCGKMIAAVKAAVPTIGDQAAAIQLANFAKQTASSVAELRNAAAKVKCGKVVQTDGWTDGWMNGQRETNRQTDRQTDG